MNTQARKTSNAKFNVLMGPVGKSKSYVHRYLHAHQYFPLNVKMDTVQTIFLTAKITELLRSAVNQVSKDVKTVFVGNTAWSTTAALLKLLLCALTDPVGQILSHAKALNTVVQ